MAIGLVPMNTAAVSSTVDDSLTLASVLIVLRRRRTWIAWPVLLMFLAAAAGALLATRRYQAMVEVQVQKEDGGAFGLESTVTGVAGSTGSDSLDYNMTLQTEIGVLRSPALALTVIEAARLEPTPDYFAPPVHGEISTAWNISLPWDKPLEPLSVPLTQAPNRRYAAEKIFKSHLKVQPVAGSRLIDISYTDRNPARAAMVANTVARVLADMAFQQRFTAALQGSTWLSGQLEDLRQRTEQAQARAAALQRGTGMFGQDGSRNVVLERLDSLNQNLTAAEGNRILKEGIDAVAATGSPELISSLAGNSSTGSVASIQTSLSLIQGLRQQESQVRSELAQDNVRYGPAYPKIGELDAQITGIAAAIAAENHRLGQRAHTDLLIATRQEQEARAAFEKQKEVATRQNESVIAYTLARQEAESNRDLYEGLLAKLKQSNLLEGLRANNISVVSAAEIPAPDHAASPNIPLWLAGALVAGLIFGIGLAGIAELTDTSVCSLAQLEATLGTPLLAVLPAMRGTSLHVFSKEQRLWRWRDVFRHLQSAKPTLPQPVLTIEKRSLIFEEELRSLRTALLLSRSGEPPKVILITSALPKEGKTTIAYTLAALLARGDARVLLVDADLRRPSLYLRGHDGQGLAAALSRIDSIATQQPIHSLPKLEMLAGNEMPPFPSELLSSPRMRELLSQWRSEYDFIVLDSPPVLPVTDAVLLAQHSDVTLLLARHRQTPRQALCRSVDALQRQSSPHASIGIVLNDVARGSAEFHEYFGYGGGVHAGFQS